MSELDGLRFVTYCHACIEEEDDSDDSYPWTPLMDYEGPTDGGVWIASCSVHGELAREVCDGAGVVYDRLLRVLDTHDRGPHRGTGMCLHDLING